MADTVERPQTQSLEELDIELNIGLSGVQCLPDFTDNIESIVGWVMDKSTTLETFIGDRVSKITSTAKSIGFSALLVLYESIDDYTE